LGKRRRRQPVNVTPRPTAPGTDIARIVREELTKALALPPGTQTYQPTAEYLRELQMRNPGAAMSAPLPANPRNTVQFGPGVPLAPHAINAPMPNSGRPAPRRWEAPVSWNTQTTTTRSVPWTILRDSADQVSVMRDCIEVVKSTLTGLEWSFGIDPKRARLLARRTGDSMHTVTSDLQDKFADKLDQLHSFWERPDRINNWTFSEWLAALLEDQLVLDAVALYPHLTLGGKLHSVELIDSSTIKPLQDERGATPQPPFPAYQQILWGFPRGELTQSRAEDVDREFVSAVYGSLASSEARRSDALIYKVRNRRSRGPYGFSCVEQALTDVEMWLRRYDWLRTEYTAGVTPDMIVQVQANMTPEQMRQYEAVFNDDLSGQSAERRRARFLPAGFDPSYPNMAGEKFTNDFDLHLIRLICAAFGVLPTSLGFTPNHGMGGMGGQGHTQSEQDTQLYRATKPTAQWVVDLINEIGTHYLGMPPEVTFLFHGLDPEDDQKEAELLTTYVQAGLQTINEARDQQNLPRYDFPEADQPMVVTPTGPVWLNVSAQPTALPGNLPAAQSQGVGPGQNQAHIQNGAQPVSQVPRPGAPAAAPNPGQPAGDAKEKKATEARKFVAFATKRAGRAGWRDFRFEAFEGDIACAANMLASAGDLDAAKVLLDEVT
jgi:hypothetical protein